LKPEDDVLVTELLIIGALCLTRVKNFQEVLSGADVMGTEIV